MVNQILKFKDETEARAIAAFWNGPQVPVIDQTPAIDLSAGIMAGNDLLRLPLHSRPALLGRWMKQGDLGYLFAPRGAGKTWMALLIAKAVAEGESLGLWEAGDQPCQVIYFDAEMNLPDVQARLRKVGTCASFKLLSNELLFQASGRGVNIACPLYQQALSKLLPDGCLFVIDNLSTAQTGMGENDNDAFDALRDWLLTLRHRGITVLIVHHAGRNGAMRGASRREDMAHWIISLKDDTQEGGLTKCFTTTFSKARNCPEHEARPLVWSLATNEERLTLTCHPNESTDVMLAHIQSGVHRATDLAEMMDTPSGTISKWARKLEAAGLIAGLIAIRNRMYYAVAEAA